MNLLAACIQDRHAYNLANESEILAVVDDKTKMILKEVAKYYDRDHSATHVDLETLTKRMHSAYPKHTAVFDVILAGCSEPVSVPNIVADIQEERRRKLKEELAVAFTQPNNDEWILDKLEDYRKACYEESMDDGDPSATVYNNLSVCDVLDGRSGENKITLSPPALNAAAGGGVLRKHHILCFARPDAGKSTFAINMTSSFLHQGFRVLYFGNEDPALDIILRMQCRLTQRTIDEIREDQEGTDKILAQRNWDKFYFKEGEPGTARELESLMDELGPDVLIVDQSRNLDMKEDNRVLQLEKAEQFIRNLGKRYDALTISFTQAGGSAEGKLILDMNDVDYSNTGMQASADLMLGIGTNAEYTSSGQRCITACKNKMAGGSKEPFVVNIDYRYNRVY